MRGLKLPKGFEDAKIEEITSDEIVLPPGFEDAKVEAFDDSKKKVRTTPASSNGSSPTQPTSGSCLS